MTDIELKELVASLAIAQRETVEQLKETDRKLKELAVETDKQLKELGKQIGGLGDKFGSFTEGMAFPSMTKILQETFNMKHISPNHITKTNGSSLELDVFAYNEELKIACIVEVKSHLKAEGVKQLIETLKKFPKFFPNFADSELYGILAFVKADKGVGEIVLKSGIYLADIHDEHFRLRVPEDFKAKNFQTN